jgi:transglutaminase-like putative cysteine protease
MRTVLNMLSTEWDRKLSAALWAVFLYQYIHWLSQQNFNGLYWLDPTIWSAQATLLLIALMEMLLNLRAWMRYAIEFAVILAVHYLYFDYTIFWTPPVSLEALEFLLAANVSQLYPYALFGFGTAAVFIVINRWGVTKGNILLAVIASVILFSILDSFSKTFYFWDQVAYVIFSGLLLIVIRHFAEFKQKHPASWQWLKEYPAKVAAPILVLISAIVLAGVLAPNAKPFLTDPYTAWKSMRGEPVIGIGKGFGNVRISSGIRGTSESGYSRNDQVIGGGFNYDYSEVMRVSTSHRSYWRGEVRALYTGKGWERGLADELTAGGPIVPGQSLIAEEPGIDTSKLETVEVTQTFTMTGEASFPVLFAAYTADRLSTFTDEESLKSFTRWLNHPQELRWMEAEAEAYPKSFQVVSRMPVIDEPGLRVASSRLPEHLAAVYLQLPDTVTQRVKELAAAVTQEATNNYDRMKLLEQYLRTEFEYTNTPDIQLGDGDDFVDDFLFQIREGYCDYFSTAMVVMARSLGVPARWVKGYASGAAEVELFLSELMDPTEMNPNGAGTYIVRNADAHSWVEVYFEGYGWIPFEPTASFTMPVLYDQESAPTLQLPESDPGGSLEESVGSQAGLGRIWARVASGIAAVVLAALLFWKRKTIVRVLHGWMHGRSLAEIEEGRYRIIYEFDRFLRYARRRGFSRSENETIRETMRRWSARATWLKPNLEQLLVLFEKAKYSAGRIEADDVRRTEQLIARLRAEMK